MIKIFLISILRPQTRFHVLYSVTSVHVLLADIANNNVKQDTKHVHCLPPGGSNPDDASHRLLTLEAVSAPC